MRRAEALSESNGQQFGAEVFGASEWFRGTLAGLLHPGSPNAAHSNQTDWCRAGSRVHRLRNRRSRLRVRADNVHRNNGSLVNRQLHPVDTPLMGH